MKIIELDGSRPHVYSILENMVRLSNAWAMQENVRGAGEEITATTPVTDERERARILAGWVMDRVIYRPDPPGTEMIKTAGDMLWQIVTRGRTFGDCDDFVALFVSLARSIGIDARPVGVQGGTDPHDPERFDHVIATVLYEDGATQDFDLCSKVYPGRRYGNRLVVK